MLQTVNQRLEHLRNSELSCGYRILRHRMDLRQTMKSLEVERKALNMSMQQQQRLMTALALWRMDQVRITLHGDFRVRSFIHALTMFVLGG